MGSERVNTFENGGLSEWCGRYQRDPTKIQFRACHSKNRLWLSDAQLIDLGITTLGDRLRVENKIRGISFFLKEISLSHR
jgi:hypothetical protein